MHSFTLTSVHFRLKISRRRAGLILKSNNWLLTCRSYVCSRCSSVPPPPNHPLYGAGTADRYERGTRSARAREHVHVPHHHVTSTSSVRLCQLELLHCPQRLMTSSRTCVTMSLMSYWPHSDIFCEISFLRYQENFVGNAKTKPWRTLFGNDNPPILTMVMEQMKRTHYIYK